MDKVIIASGFGEVGPWDGLRTRREREVRRVFIIEGCINSESEMA